jgi:hypothetical protein
MAANPIAPPPPPPPPPAPVPPSTALKCPKCGSMAPPNSRYCNVCGSSLFTQAGSSTGTQAPAGAPPLDLREKIESDRGTLKRLQLLVPGFRGYRQGEDIREADSFLRIQVADRVKNARATIENARQALTNANQFQALYDLAPLISDLWRFEGEVRHAEQGYTGISPAVRINPQQLDRLYEYDYGFVSAADTLSQTIAPLPTLAGGADAGATGQLLATARSQLNQLEQAFKARIQVIEGIRIS